MVRFGEFLTELSGAIALYGTDLSVIHREIGSIYLNWWKDLILGKPTIGYFDDLFKMYSSWKAKKLSLERDALKKWVTTIGGIYAIAMTVYFYILNFMQFKPDYTFGFVIPVSFAILLILFLLAIFSREER